MARRPALWVPARGEIIFMEHSPHVGKEMPGLYPMLVCSTAAFAGKTGVVLASKGGACGRSGPLPRERVVATARTAAHNTCAHNQGDGHEHHPVH